MKLHKTPACSCSKRLFQFIGYPPRTETFQEFKLTAFQIG
jgi:hypothetical protein